MSRLIAWALPLTTAAVYGWLVFGPGAQLIALAGGLAPFDLRPGGYDLDAALRVLVALPPEGHALYLGPVRRLDTALPILMGLTFLWWMRPPTTPFGAVAAAAALAYVALDLAENHAVARLVEGGAVGLSPERVRAASQLTQAKFMAFALAAVLAARAVRVRARRARATSRT